jgi:putative peptidoglycan lipid II flippase
VKIAVPTFYALRDSRTPTIVSMITMGVNVAVNLALVRLLGYRGLALGTALAAWFNAATLLWLLRGRLGGLDGGPIAVAFAKIATASIAMGLAAQGGETWLRNVVPGGSAAAQLVRVGAAIGIGLLTLGLSARLLRIREFDQALRLVTNRLRRSRRHGEDG